MSTTRIAGFRLGIYVFKDAEIIDFAAPYGVFSVARSRRNRASACTSYWPCSRKRRTRHSIIPCCCRLSRGTSGRPAGW
ncbi:MAG TPA: hypothetical protein VEU97_04285, partial [Ktedonobacteraceae bacterium]|nr:hypothetical protein [Ktedonobacteraceae bacterium]